MIIKYKSYYYLVCTYLSIIFSSVSNELCHTNNCTLQYIGIKKLIETLYLMNNDRYHKNYGIAIYCKIKYIHYLALFKR